MRLKLEHILDKHIVAKLRSEFKINSFVVLMVKRQIDAIQSV